MQQQETTTSSTCSSHVRQIRAFHDDDTIRFYQAYNNEIADAAVASNGFRGPMEQGLWSPSRMTWIKPSKVWMAYRCGWALLKDRNQFRVLALDISRVRFFQLLEQHATLSHDTGENKKKNDNKKTKNNAPAAVVVQWDPERVMTTEEDGKNVYTKPLLDERSIQIGLRNEGVEALLDPDFLIQITDVTNDFQSALKALEVGNLEAAHQALWPKNTGLVDGEEEERAVSVSNSIQSLLQMSPSSPLSAKKQRKAIVVLGSAGNPPHEGHLHCLKLGATKARELGYDVLWSTVALAPAGYLQQKMKQKQKEHGNNNCFLLSDESRLHLLELLSDDSKSETLIKVPDRCYGSALECGQKLRPSDDTTIVIVVGGDRAKKGKWKRPMKDGVITVCCPEEESAMKQLQMSFEQDTKEGLVQDTSFHFVWDETGPSTRSTLVRSILERGKEGAKSGSTNTLIELQKVGYSKAAALYLLEQAGRMKVCSAMS